jgi:hypothetical protein
VLLTGASLSFGYETIFMAMRTFPWCTQTARSPASPPRAACRRGSAPEEYELHAPYF